MDGAVVPYLLMLTIGINNLQRSSCVLIASVARSLEPSECPTLCVCKSTITCSFGGEAGQDINLIIQENFDSLKLDITYLKLRDESSIKTVPEIICQMTMLEELDLTNNSITKLPIGCFTRLCRLRDLCLDRNQISEVQKGVFDGLQKLETLQINRNKLTFIDHQIFSNVSNLVSLKRLEMEYNQLTSFDVWPFARAYSYPGFYISLGYNKISNSTNIERWVFKCGMHSLNLMFKLDENPLGRISGHLKTFVKSFTDMACMYNRHAESDLIISVSDVYITCDCLEFAYVRNNRFFRHAHGLDQAVCSQPSNLEGQRIMYLNIDQLVCDIVEQCPPGCKCTKQPSTLTMYVNCTQANLTEMPLNLPPIKPQTFYRYKLILMDNQIKRLEYRDYMQKTKYLDVSHAGVTDIVEERVWRAFQYISNVNLNRNQLKQIPEYVELLDFSNITFDIRDNPISCDCKNQWLKSWIELLSSEHQNVNGINCYEPYWLNGKAVLTLDKEEFCRGPSYTIQDILEITIPSISGVILLNLISVFLFKRFRIQIYKYVKLHPFDRDECVGEDINHDVFLACAGEDGALGYSILKLLERSGCKVCYHKKDFIPGEHIIENIMQAVKRSKRTLCVLTGNFIKSGWCMEEFRQSHYRDLQQGKKRLVVLLVDPHALETEEMSLELRDYLSRYTYIEYESKSWKDRLMYAMPVNRMNKDDVNTQDEDDEDCVMIRA